MFGWWPNVSFTTIFKKLLFFCSWFHSSSYLWIPNLSDRQFRGAEALLWPRLNLFSGAKNPERLNCSNVVWSTGLLAAWGSLWLYQKPSTSVPLHWLFHTPPIHGTYLLTCICKQTVLLEIEKKNTYIYEYIGKLYIPQRKKYKGDCGNNSLNKWWDILTDNILMIIY